MESKKRQKYSVQKATKKMVSVSANDVSIRHKFAVGTVLKKRFHSDSKGRRTKVWEGQVIALFFDEKTGIPLYRVKYTDDDAEDMLERDLVTLITTPVLATD